MSGPRPEGGQKRERTGGSAGEEEGAEMVRRGEAAGGAASPDQSERKAGVGSQPRYQRENQTKQRDWSAKRSSERMYSSDAMMVVLAEEERGGLMALVVVVVLGCWRPAAEEVEDCWRISLLCLLVQREESPSSKCEGSLFSRRCYNSLPGIYCLLLLYCRAEWVWVSLPAICTSTIFVESSTIGFANSHA